MKTSSLCILMLISGGFLWQSNPVLAQGTAFTYQGRLINSGQPANGAYDLRLSVYDSSTNGTLVAGPLTNAATAVSNGLFTITADFGPGVFTGAARWLQLDVSPAGSNNFTALSPRQALTPVPYSVFSSGASNVLGILPSGGLAGTYSSPLSFNNPADQFQGSFGGNGNALTNISMAGINSFGSLGLATNGLLFVVSATAATGSEPLALLSLDVNGDGKPDLICANLLTNYLTVLTNNGNGAFAFATNLAVGNNPADVIAADINGDGKLDLICANYGDSTVTVLTNNGNGGFISAGSTAVGLQPFGLAAADVNGDGKIDLITANTGTNTLTVLINNGNNTFLPIPITVGPSPYSVVATNITGNTSTSGSRPDLVCANFGTNTLTVLTNNGNGTFSLAATLTVGSEPAYLAAADLNGDGSLDLVCANEGTNTLSVYTNLGHGSFNLAATITVGYGPSHVLAADLNGDGKVDLVSANLQDGSLTVLTNQGFGVFSLAETIALGAPDWVVSADFNGDGRADLAAANPYANTVTILTNCPFAVSSELTIYGQNGGLRLAAGGAGVPDVIGGAGANMVGPGVSGSIIAGGGTATGANEIQSDFSSIGGGTSNLIQSSSDYSVISGGSGNTNNGYYTVVAGGWQNSATAEGANVSGGALNSNSGEYSVLSGGYANNVTSNYSTVGGGYFNTNTGPWAVLGGGWDNVNNSYGGVLNGGRYNFCDGPFTIVGGGEYNTCTMNFSVVAGGIQNTNNGFIAVIGGGGNNFNQGFYSTVAGGNGNSANARYDTIGGGQNNTTYGDNATVPGGAGNTAQGVGSFAAGQNARAVTDGAFVWADGSTSAAFSSTSNNQFLVRAAGGVGINTANPNGDSLYVVGNRAGGVGSPAAEIENTSTATNASPALRLVLDGGNAPEGVLSVSAFSSSGRLAEFMNLGAYVVVITNDGTIYCKTTVNTSDRNAKQDFTNIDAKTILAKVAALPVTEWSYKDDPATRHIGPVAQDFQKSFQVGIDDTHIATIDEGGVALAAIKGLDQLLKEKDAEIQELKKRLERLEKRTP